MENEKRKKIKEKMHQNVFTQDFIGLSIAQNVPKARYTTLYPYTLFSTNKCSKQTHIKG